MAEMEPTTATDLVSAWICNDNGAYPKTGTTHACESARDAAEAVGQPGVERLLRHLLLWAPDESAAGQTYLQLVGEGLSLDAVDWARVAADLLVR